MKRPDLLQHLRNHGIEVGDLVAQPLVDAGYAIRDPDFQKNRELHPLIGNPQVISGVPVIKREGDELRLYLDGVRCPHSFGVIGYTPLRERALVAANFTVALWQRPGTHGKPIYAYSILDGRLPEFLRLAGLK